MTKAVEQGFRSFKIKIGLNPEFDLECVKAAREAAGPRIEIGFDINGGYSVLEAVRTLRKMERYDPSHVEEPVNSANIRALTACPRNTVVEWSRGKIGVVQQCGAGDEQELPSL